MNNDFCNNGTMVHDDEIEREYNNKSVQVNIYIDGNDLSSFIN